MSRDTKPESSQSLGFELIDPKKLAKLVKACRSAGITYFKQGNLEFTLGTVSQPKVVNGALKQTGDTPDPISEDTLTEEQLMFYSVMDIPGAEKDTQ